MNRFNNALLNPGSLCDVLPLLQNLFLYEDLFDAFDLKQWQLLPCNLLPQNVQPIALPRLVNTPISLIEVSWQLIRAAIATYYTDQHCWDQKLQYNHGGFGGLFGSLYEVRLPQPGTVQRDTSKLTPLAGTFYDAKGVISAKFCHPQKRRFRKLTSSSSSSNGRKSSPAPSLPTITGYDNLSLPEALVSCVFALNYMRVSADELNKLIVSTCYMIKTFPSMSPDLCAACVEAYSVVLSYSAVQGYCKDTLSSAVQAHLKLPFNWAHKISQLDASHQAKVLCDILKVLLLLDLKGTSGKSNSSTLLLKTRRALTNAGSISSPLSASRPLGESQSVLSPLVNELSSTFMANPHVKPSLQSNQPKSCPAVKASWESLCAQICAKKEVLFSICPWIVSQITMPVNAVLNQTKQSRKLQFTILDPDYCLKILFTQPGNAHNNSNFLKSGITGVINSATSQSKTQELAAGDLVSEQLIKMDCKQEPHVHAKGAVLVPNPSVTSDTVSNERLKRHRIPLAVCALLVRTGNISCPISFLYATTNYDVNVLSSIIEIALKKANCLYSIARDLEQLFTHRPNDIEAFNVVVRSIPGVFEVSSLLKNVETQILCNCNERTDGPVFERAVLLPPRRIITAPVIASACYSLLPEPESAAQLFKSFPTIRPLLQSQFPAITTSRADDSENEGDTATRLPKRRRSVCNCTAAHLQVTNRLKRADPVKGLLHSRGRTGWSVIHGYLLCDDHCLELMAPSGSPEATGALLAEYARDLKSCKNMHNPSPQQALWYLQKVETWLVINRLLLFKIWGWRSVWRLDDEGDDRAPDYSPTAEWMGPGKINDPTASMAPVENAAGRASDMGKPETIDFNWDNTIPEEAATPGDDIGRQNRILRYTAFSVAKELLIFVSNMPRSLRKQTLIVDYLHRISGQVLHHFTGFHSDGKQQFKLELISDVPNIQLHEATCQQTMWLALLYSLYLNLSQPSKHKKGQDLGAEQAAVARKSKQSILACLSVEIVGIKQLVCYQVRRLCLTRYLALHPVRSSFNAPILNGPSGAMMSPDIRRNLLFSRSDLLHETILKVAEALRVAVSEDSKSGQRRLRREQLQSAYSSFWEELRDKGVVAQLLLSKYRPMLVSSAKSEPLICSRSKRIMSRFKAWIAPGQSFSVIDVLTSVLLNSERKTHFHNHYIGSSPTPLTELSRREVQLLYAGILHRRYVSSNLLLSNNLDLDRLLSAYLRQQQACLLGNVNSPNLIGNGGAGGSPNGQQTWVEGLLALQSLDPGAPTLPLRYSVNQSIRPKSADDPQSAEETLIIRAIKLASPSELASHIPQFIHNGIRLHSWYSAWHELLLRGSRDGSFLALLHRSLLSEILIQSHSIQKKLQRSGAPSEMEIVHYLRLCQFGILMIEQCACIGDILRSSDFIEFLVKMSGLAFNVEFKDREKFIRGNVLKYCQKLNLSTHGSMEGGTDFDSHLNPPQMTELKQIVSIETMLRSKIISECQSKSSLSLGASSRQSIINGMIGTTPSGKGTACNNLGDFSLTSQISQQSQGCFLNDGSAPFLGGSNFVVNPNEGESVIISPLNGQRILSVDVECTKVLKSAAKVPYTLRFEYGDDQQNTRVPQPLIFKCNDDIRQDMLVSQVSCLMNSIFVRAGLPLRIITYKAVPVILLEQDRSIVYGGIIEMLENCKSRHEIGDIFGLTLDGYYSRSYSSQSLEQARWNFTTSLAAASLLTFILQIKDRHNANILLTHDGYLVHIDFGFILDLAPAHDLKFERAPFKLTSEMIGLIDGGSQESSGSLILRQLITHGYLALRVHKKELVSLIESYRYSNLRGYKHVSITHLKTRLQYDKSDRDATEYILRQTRAAVNALTTKLYDVFQSGTWCRMHWAILLGLVGLTEADSGHKLGLTHFKLCRNLKNLKPITRKEAQAHQPFVYDLSNAFISTEFNDYLRACVLWQMAVSANEKEAQHSGATEAHHALSLWIHVRDCILRNCDHAFAAIGDSRRQLKEFMEEGIELFTCDAATSLDDPLLPYYEAVRSKYEITQPMCEELKMLQEINAIRKQKPATLELTNDQLITGLYYSFLDISKFYAITCMQDNACVASSYLIAPIVPTLDAFEEQRLDNENDQWWAVAVHLHKALNIIKQISTETSKEVDQKLVKNQFYNLMLHRAAKTTTRPDYLIDRLIKWLTAYPSPTLGSVQKMNHMVQKGLIATKNFVQTKSCTGIREVTTPMRICSSHRMPLAQWVTEGRQIIDSISTRFVDPAMAAIYFSNVWMYPSHPQMMLAMSNCIEWTDQEEILKVIKRVLDAGPEPWIHQSAWEFIASLRSQPQYLMADVYHLEGLLRSQCYPKAGFRKLLIKQGTDAALLRLTAHLSPAERTAAKSALIQRRRHVKDLTSLGSLLQVHCILMAATQYTSDTAFFKNANGCLSVAFEEISARVQAMGCVTLTRTDDPFDQQLFYLNWFQNLKQSAKLGLLTLDHCRVVPYVVSAYVTASLSRQFILTPLELLEECMSLYPDSANEFVIALQHVIDRNLLTNTNANDLKTIQLRISSLLSSTADFTNTGEVPEHWMLSVPFVKKLCIPPRSTGLHDDERAIINSWFDQLDYFEGSCEYHSELTSMIESNNNVLANHRRSWEGDIDLACTLRKDEQVSPAVSANLELLIPTLKRIAEWRMVGVDDVPETDVLRRSSLDFASLSVLASRSSVIALQRGLMLCKTLRNAPELGSLINPITYIARQMIDISDRDLGAISPLRHWIYTIYNRNIQWVKWSLERYQFQYIQAPDFSKNAELRFFFIIGAIADGFNFNMKFLSYENFDEEVASTLPAPCTLLKVALTDLAAAKEKGMVKPHDRTFKHVVDFETIDLVLTFPQTDLMMLWFYCSNNLPDEFSEDQAEINAFGLSWDSSRFKLPADINIEETIGLLRPNRFATESCNRQVEDLFVAADALVAAANNDELIGVFVSMLTAQVRNVILYHVHWSDLCLAVRQSSVFSFLDTFISCMRQFVSQHEGDDITPAILIHFINTLQPIVTKDIQVPNDLSPNQYEATANSLLITVWHKFLSLAANAPTTPFCTFPSDESTNVVGIVTGHKKNG